MKFNERIIAKGLFLSFIFAEAVCLGAFVGLHSKHEDRGNRVIETVALSAPSASTEPCEGIVEPIEPMMIESFTAEALCHEIEESLVEDSDDYLEEESSETLYFDVPLNEDLQDYIFELCEEDGIDPAIVIAMIDKESKYDADIIGDKGRSYGLMQIQPRWHEERIEELGITDLLDPYQNMTVGIDILAELLEGGRSIEEALMIYNGGYSHASSYIENGTLSEYVTYVIDLANELERK